MRDATQPTVTITALAAQGVDELRAIQRDLAGRLTAEVATVENFGEDADKWPRVVIIAEPADTDEGTWVALREGRLKFIDLALTIRQASVQLLGIVGEHLLSQPSAALDVGDTPEGLVAVGSSDIAKYVGRVAPDINPADVQGQLESGGYDDSYTVREVLDSALDSILRRRAARGYWANASH